MLEKDLGELSECCEKNWKFLKNTPVAVVYYNLEKVEGKDHFEYLTRDKKKINYQKNGKVIRGNIEEIKDLEPFKNLLEQIPKPQDF